MKKLFLILSAVLVVNMAHAQLFQLGLKAGVSSSKAQVDEAFQVNGSHVTYKTGDAVLGWHIGIYSRIKIVSFFIQPEVLFSSTGGDIEITEQGVTTPDIGTLKMNKLDVPVMAGLTLGKFFRIYVGPTFSYLISENIDGKDWFSEIKQDYNSATIGYQAGIGLDISKLTIDLKYEGNLSKLGDAITIPTTNTSFNTDMRNPQIILSVGLRLL